MTEQEEHLDHAFTVWCDKYLGPRDARERDVARRAYLAGAGDAAEENARLKAALPQPAKCPNGHEWSNPFGCDWTPEDWMRCDCGERTWGGQLDPSA